MFFKVIQQPGVWNAGICVRMPMGPHLQCWQQALVVLEHPLPALGKNSTFSRYFKVRSCRKPRWVLRRG